jgi:hypothetical protein
VLHQLYLAIDHAIVFAVFHPRLTGLIIIGLLLGCAALVWFNRKDRP